MRSRAEVPEWRADVLSFLSPSLTITSYQLMVKSTLLVLASSRLLLPFFAQSLDILNKHRVQFANMDAHAPSAQITKAENATTVREDLTLQATSTSCAHRRPHETRLLCNH